MGDIHDSDLSGGNAFGDEDSWLSGNLGGSWNGFLLGRTGGEEEIPGPVYQRDRETCCCPTGILEDAERSRFQTVPGLCHILCIVIDHVLNNEGFTVLMMCSENIGSHGHCNNVKGVPRSRSVLLRYVLRCDFSNLARFFSTSTTMWDLSSFVPSRTPWNS